MYNYRTFSALLNSYISLARSILFQCLLAAQLGCKLTSLSVLHFVTVHAPNLLKGNMNAETGAQLKCDFMAT